MPRATLKDLAKACGISTMAASYAMRGRSEVSEQLRQIVQKKAEEIGYIPSSLGRKLRGAAPKKIGVVLSQPAHPVAMRNLIAFDAACRERGYQAEARYHYWHRDLERKIVTELLEEGVAGLLIMPASTETGALFAGLADQNLKAPFIGLSPLGDQVHHIKHYFGSIAPNAHATGHLVLEHLASLGHQRIAFVFQTVPSHASPLSEMAQGFLQASQEVEGVHLELFNLAPSSSPVQKRITNQEPCSMEDIIETDRLLARYFLDHMKDVSAVVASDDLSAVSLYNECLRRGIRVPEDLSLMSLGGSYICDLTAARMSHASVPMEEIAKNLLSRLLDGVDDGSRDYSYNLSIVNAETLSDLRAGGGRSVAPIPRKRLRLLCSHSESPLTSHFHSHRSHLSPL